MKKETVTTLSVIANIFLTAAKFIIGMLAMSASVMAEAIHSGMDIVTSVISYIGIRASKKPSDKEHPYGHQQSETIAGFIITIALFLSSIYIIYEAVIDFMGVKTIAVSYFALSIMAGSAIINLIMSELKMRVGKEHESMALIADANHSRMDVFTSVGVFVGLILSSYWIYADSVAAILIGIYIMWGSIRLGKKTTDILLNISAGEEVEDEIKKVLNDYRIDISNLKTQKLGSEIFAELKIKLEPKLKVEDVEKITNEIEGKIRKKIPNIKYIVIQIESKKEEIRKSFYRGRFGKISWGRGRMGGTGAGPGGKCVCPECGEIVNHERGVPCYQQKCPKCGSKMTRKDK